MSHVWHGGDESVGLSTATRFLIHFTMDVHQPLHATARVDDAFPAGDRGGNSLAVANRDGAKNMHAVWDSVIYTQEGYATLPFPDADWENLTERALKIYTENPISKKGSDAASLDPFVWSYDSFRISKEFLYKDVVAGGVLSSDYVAKAQKFTEHQIALGGYRLAHIWIDILGKNAEKDKFLN